MSLASQVLRIVGHAELEVELANGRPVARFKVLNDPRFFEKLVVGRRFDEVPRIVSRICGPCSVSHTLCSISALERALGVEVPEEVAKLREAAVACEVAENHLVHLALLALPDYLGYESSAEMARDRPELVRRVLEARATLSRVGGAIVGRLTHPNACVVGGFSKALTPSRLRGLARELRGVLGEVEEVARLALDVEYPDVEVAGEVPLVVGGEGYAFIGRTLELDRNEGVEPSEYLKLISEVEVPYSTCRRVTAGGSPVYVGARARLNARHSSLTGRARELASALKLPLRNPFDNLKAKAVELVYTVERAASVLKELAESSKGDRLRVKVRARAGEGVGVKEAPRGTLIHHYRLGEDGRVRYANIITPTTINSYHLELACAELVREMGIGEGVVRELGKLVRAYDPCLGCATHYVRVVVRW